MFSLLVAKTLGRLMGAVRGEEAGKRASQDSPSLDRRPPIVPGNCPCTQSFMHDSSNKPETLEIMCVQKQRTNTTLMASSNHTA